MRVARMLAQVSHRVVLAYQVACARQDVRNQGLRVPAGLWCCTDCGQVGWDRDAYIVHGRLHEA